MPFKDEKFHDAELPQEKTPCATYSILLIASVYRNNKSYYSQVILEERKYMVKDRTERYITKDLVHSVSDSSSNDQSI